jgi:hypothetical protein
MKKIFSFLIAFVFIISAFPQAPQKLSYQAVIRNAGNQLVTNQQVRMRISILQGSATGTPVYVEIQTPTTNLNGLATLEIGGGTPVTGTFTGIDWSTGTYFIKNEADPTGGTNYTITGTSQVLSVPYALHAETVASYPESDPIFGAWNKSTGISINASQVSDLTTTVTNNPAMLANTAKNSYPTADAAKVALLSGTNTGDETTSTIKTKLGITTLSGSNTGDNAVNTLYSGLVTNATHTGDATGATALTVVRINGTSLAGLATGLLKNTTATGVPSIAVAGTDYLTPTGSAALLTNFPVLNQNTTGNAATVTTNANLTGMVTSVGNSTTVVTNANLTGEVTSVGNATTVDNSAVLSKSLTGYTSGAGTVSATDNILTAIQKLNGNIANINGSETKVTAGTNVTVTGTGTTASPYIINQVQHIVGESYQGGTIFYVYDNGLHGLIAANTDAAVNGNPNLYFIYGTSPRTTGAIGTGIGAGRMNTSLIMASQSAATPSASNLSTLSIALGAIMYSATDAQGVKYADWYVPSYYEMILMSQNLSVIPAFSGNWYWTSTEVSDTPAYALAFYGGSATVQGKDGALKVRAIRQF